MTTGARYKYEPRNGAKYWTHVEEFVDNCLIESEGRTSYSLKELTAALGPLSIWCWQTGSASLDTSEVLDRDVIEMFVTTGLSGWTNASRNTIRSRLLRLAEVLAPDQPPVRLRPYGNSDASAPYTLQEQAAFLSWARSQGTLLRRTNAEVLLALGFGAGLSNEELIRVRRRDLDVSDAGTTVHVAGTRERDVPFLEQWATLLTQLQVAGSDEWVFLPGRRYRSANLTGLFVMKSDGRPTLLVRRMRASWIVHHLNRGTPILPLLTAAGLRTLEPVDRFLPHAAPWSDTDIASALR
ncbi:hypothetical protein [Agromyces badenianii]|uniref:hypothetical protein n=1 Tax=Agromyces badenianii TaxID=2080742 RepID=UPI0011B27ACF|nr:hypothetical protein [Agromyces badenianii]